MGWSNDQVSSLTLPEGATTGARIVLDGTSDTIEVFDSSNNLAAVLAGEAGSDSEGDSWGTGLTMNEGAITAPNSPVNGASLSSVGDVTFNGGQSLIQTLNIQASSVIAYGLVPATSLPWPTTASTSETGVLTLGAQLTAGRLYRISVDNVFVVGGGTDIYGWRLHWTTDGSAPSLSSEWYMQSQTQFTNAENISIPGEVYYLTPTSSITLNTMLSIFSDSSHSWQLLSYHSLTGPVITVEDCGQNGVVNTGVVIDEGSPPAPPSKHTKVYTATSYKSFAANGSEGPAYFADPAHIYQGYYPSLGNCIGCYAFDNATILSDTSGATINSATLTLNCQHTYYTSGMTGYFAMSKSGFTGNTFNPGTLTGIGSASTSAGSTCVLENAGIVSSIKNGYVTFAMYDGESREASYGYFATNPTLTVEYTK